MLQEEDDSAFDCGGHLAKKFIGCVARKSLNGFHKCHIPYLHCIEECRLRIGPPVLLSYREYPAKATSRNTTPSCLVAFPVLGQLFGKPRIGANVGNRAKTGFVDFEG